MNFLAGRIAGSDGNSVRVAVAGGEITLPRPTASTGDVTFGIRPEHIGLQPENGIKLADVTIDLVEQLGGQTMIYATTGDGQSLTIAVDGQRHLALGSKLTTYLDPARCHLFGADGKVI